jgi:phosphopantetheinyl transferase
LAVLANAQDQLEVDALVARRERIQNLFDWGDITEAQRDARFRPLLHRERTLARRMAARLV